MQMQRAFLLGLVCIFVWACATPELCRQDFIKAADAAQRAFDASDSAGFVHNLADARASFECSAPQNSEPVEGRGIEVRNSALLELEKALPCRMYVERINQSLAQLKHTAEETEAVWGYSENRWKTSLRNHPNNNDWKSSCLQEDAQRYEALVDEGNALIGYRLTDDVLEQVEAGIQQIEGVLKGGVDRIKKAVE